MITGQAVAHDGKPFPSHRRRRLQTSQAGQDFTGLGQTQTDANGAFAFRVPPGPNRTLRFSYTLAGQRRRQAKGQSRRRRCRSGPPPTCKVSDHKIAGGRRVTFRGQLKGGPIPAGGVPIGFRGKVGKHTRKFADTQTDDQGRFHLTYKFPATGPPRPPTRSGYASAPTATTTPTSPA